MDGSAEIKEEHACAGGTQRVYEHPSTATGTPMRFALYLPERPRALLVYLSGLTCSEQNVITKGHFQATANAEGVAVLCPDTSPRGPGVPDDDAWDMGQGASFYLDATEPPWDRHFRMRTWLLQELLPLVQGSFEGPLPVGITGHSMGGHGALVLALSHPDRFGSVSAIAPVSAATRCPWGQKALPRYLGDDPRVLRGHDAAWLLQDRGWGGPILVDQGLADPFLEEQLKPELLEQAAEARGVALTLRRHPRYDHSYYFISTVLGEHVAFHARALTAG